MDFGNRLRAKRDQAINDAKKAMDDAKSASAKQKEAEYEQTITSILALLSEKRLEELVEREIAAPHVNGIPTKFAFAISPTELVPVKVGPDGKLSNSSRPASPHGLPFPSVMPGAVIRSEEVKQRQTELRAAGVKVDFQAGRPQGPLVFIIDIGA
ncbi:hypothetical protein N7E70_018280 [Aminobacter sp. NyZ550]|uniref:hypothetical protein n=1 Tax=Aminobacter sp. NyZ550 TaxID=2979870 RepID=UPI0021D5B7F7|nr:hypothetical protein [Aminobacter sp. NyZ550]WAX93625.1 hypothetical protein N7E70_018280 [Aminobacter sp. NyZ550]